MKHLLHSVKYSSASKPNAQGHC